MPTVDHPLDARVQQSLQTCYESLLKRGELLTRERLTECYARFRDRFGPDRLQSLDGETLLNAMHARGNYDSLVYWLEFKNDDEFPARRFGSIFGGSALKFGLYQSKDTGEWLAGHSREQTTLTVDMAVNMARKQRDQLVAATTALQKLPSGADDHTYATLQEELDSVAPGISRFGWGHKYLSLLFPDKLDDFHNEDWQRHNLLRLLQLPPTKSGLYVSAGRFVRLATLMGWPMNHLTEVLYNRNGSPTRYWRIGTKDDKDRSIWSNMRAGGFAAIGWASLGDLTSDLAGNDAKEKIAARLKVDGSGASVASRKAGEICHFAKSMAENDVILAADGEHIIGVGRLKGPYRFDPTPPTDAPHRRDVEWLSVAEWKLPIGEGLRTTVWQIKKDDRNELAAEERMLDFRPSQEKPYSIEDALNGLFIPRAEFVSLLADWGRKKNAILQGPPGVGKTFIAKRLAYALMGVNDPSRVEMVQFHQSYAYEDFVQGWRPKEEGGFYLKHGIFYNFCRRAAADTPRRYVFIIDEINRGNLSRILGELMFLIEPDHRGEKFAIPLTYSKNADERFCVPENVYVLGMMNTADRSLSMVDYALRRRFCFTQLLPAYGTLEFRQFLSGRVDPSLIDRIVDRMTVLNGQISKDKNLGKGFEIGHSFFCPIDGEPSLDDAWYEAVIKREIAPLVREYWFDDLDNAERLIADLLK